MNRKRLFVIVGGILGALLIAGGAIVLHVLPTMLADSFNYPVRQPLVKNPEDYGLAYEEVRFKTEDGVTLAGWLMMGSGDDVVIIGHPAFFTRYGYSLEHEGPVPSGLDRDVELLPTAKHLVDAGYSVLMYDQRNHGESGASPNNGIHSPVEAYRDNVAAVKFVAQHPELAGKDIGLLSFCQSSLVSMVGMSKEPQAYEDAGVKAMVVVQPTAMTNILANLGLPGFVIERIQSISVADGGTDFEDQNPLLYAGDVMVPVLFVQALGDPWSDIEHIRTIYETIPTEKEAIWIEGDLHRFDTYNWFNDNPEPLLSFFDQNLGEN